MSSGEVIGSYQLTAPADGNPFGPYWLATHLVTGETYRLQRWGYECSQAQYLELMQRISQLRHPNLLPIVEFGFVRPGMAWTVTRPQTGDNLTDILDRGEPLNASMAAQIAGGILAALDVAHGLGIAHGSLEASSFLVSESQVLVDGWGAVYPSAHAMTEAQRRDLSSVAEILRQLFPEPAPSLAAILASPPVSMAAFKADFEAATPDIREKVSSLLPSPTPGEAFQQETLLPSRGVDSEPEENGEHTVEMGAPLSTISVYDTIQETSTTPISGSTTQNENTFDATRTQEHVNPVIYSKASADFDEPTTGWGVDTGAEKSSESSDKDDDPYEWVDEQREQIRVSNRYAPVDDQSDDSWGVIDGKAQSDSSPNSPSNVPIGMRVHTVRRDESEANEDSRELGDGAPWLKWVVVVGILVGLGVVATTYFPVSTGDKAHAKDSVKTEEDELLALIDSKSQPPKGGEPADAATVPNQPSVLVTFAPVEVTVTRADNGEVVCENARECELPINVNYRAKHPKYDVLLISGDDLYDRRVSGRWRRVMKPKTAGANNGR